MFVYKPELHLAGLTASNGVSVKTLLQKPGEKLPIVNAYALARLSRNPLESSFEKILQEVLAGAKDPLARMKNIVDNYGHTSVTDLASQLVVLEGICILNSMEFFYQCRLQGGQETSTRYVDFAKAGSYIEPPSALPLKAQEGYKRIINKQFYNYQKLKGPTSEYLTNVFKPNTRAEESALSARVFDCLRYLLPLGTRTAAGAIQSPRQWSKWLKYCFSSKDKEIIGTLGEVLFSLLTQEREGYIPEADILIRHTYPYPDVMEKLVDKSSIYDGECFTRIAKPLEVEIVTPNLARRLAQLKHPNIGNATHYVGVNTDVRELGNALFGAFSHHVELGPIGQWGAITTSGFLDIGAIKDLNRQRSLEVFVPFLHQEARVHTAVSNAVAEDQYAICPYLKGTELESAYSVALRDAYLDIQDWISRTPDEAESYKEVAVKRMLPQAHLVRYEISGSPADWSYVLNLRVRNGGHITYREWSYKVAEKLAERDPLYEGLRDKLVKPDPSNREQFFDRS